MSRKIQKASDVFRETTFLLGSKTSDFGRAFPGIKDVEVVVTESGRVGYSPHEGTSTRTYRRSSFPGEYVNCSNPLCYNGGFRLGQYLRDMSHLRLAESSESMSCQGYEGSPKGRRNYGPCFNHFQVQIRITYGQGPSKKSS